jgi:hypothetical protein
MGVVQKWVWLILLWSCRLFDQVFSKSRSNGLLVRMAAVPDLLHRGPTTRHRTHIVSFCSTPWKFSQLGDSPLLPGSCPLPSDSGWPSRPLALILPYILKGIDRFKPHNEWYRQLPRCWEWFTWPQNNALGRMLFGGFRLHNGGGVHLSTWLRWGRDYPIGILHDHRLSSSSAP